MKKRMRMTARSDATLRRTPIAPTAVPAIDFAAAEMPLAEILEIGPSSNRETAAPVGLAPCAHDDG